MIKEHHPAKHARRFGYAFSGLHYALMNEANFRIHTIAALLVVGMGFYFHFSIIEWLFLTLAIGFVFLTEIINTLIEEVVDHLIQEHHEGAKIIKDLGSASVLTAAIISLIMGVLLFGPRLLALV